MLARSPNAAATERRLFELAAKARAPLLVASAAIALGGAAIIGQMLIAGHLIASARQLNEPSLAFALAGLLGVIAVRAAAAGIAERAAQHVATRVKSRLRLRLVERLIVRGPAELSREHTGEIVTAAIDGVERLDAFCRRFAPQVMATAIVPPMVLLTVAWIDPLSGVVLAVTGPLIPVFMWLLGALAEARARDQWSALGRLGGRFLDTLQGLPTLTAFGRASDAAAQLVKASDQLRITTMGVLRVAFLSGFVLELTASLSIAVIAAGIGIRLLEGWMTFEPGLVVLLLAPEFYLPFRQLAQRRHAAMEGVAAADRVFALLDGPNPEPDAGTVTSEPLPDACPVTFDAVSVAYPDSSGPAVREVSFELRPGTLTAIVGPSGAGKSTLIRVLLRFVEPQAGRVLLNGRASGDMTAAEWRRHIALVSQRPRFLDGSILDNLRMAQPEASLETVRAAARMAQADAFVSALPAGYDTGIDDTASTLSGGERQRLAIARALLKRSPVLVLDEPSSSVDAETEEMLAATLARVARERTVLMVTHRAATLRHADTIIALEGGRVVDVRTEAA